jgi:hypothetical protein
MLTATSQDLNQNKNLWKTEVKRSAFYEDDETEDDEKDEDDAADDIALNNGC